MSLKFMYLLLLSLLGIIMLVYEMGRLKLFSLGLV